MNPQHKIGVKPEQMSEMQLPKPHHCADPKFSMETYTKDMFGKHGCFFQYLGKYPGTRYF